MIVDLPSRITRLVLGDGRTLSVISPRLAEAAPEFRRLLLDVDRGAALVTTKRGETALVELDPSRWTTDGVQRVFLDTNMWIRVAQANYAPQKVSRAERDAARRLADLAAERRILVPASGMSMVEIASRAAVKRQDVATTMLQTSRGWVLHHPLRIARSELASAMLAVRPRAVDAITLEGETFLNAAQLPALDLPGALATERFDSMSRRIVASLAKWAAMLDDSPSSDDERQAALAHWADVYRDVADWATQNNFTASQARAHTTMTMIMDLQVQAVEVAQSLRLPPPFFASFMDRVASGGFLEMPMLGRLHELIYHRVRDRNRTWTGNDLTDVFMLSAAAGYTDVVVGERETISHLRRAASVVPPGAAAFPTLADAIEHIEGQAAVFEHAA